MHDTSSLTMLSDYPGWWGFSVIWALSGMCGARGCGFLAVLV